LLITTAIASEITSVHGLHDGQKQTVVLLYLRSDICLKNR